VTRLRKFTDVDNLRGEGRGMRAAPSFCGRFFGDFVGFGEADGGLLCWLWDDRVREPLPLSWQLAKKMLVAKSGKCVITTYLRLYR